MPQVLILNPEEHTRLEYEQKWKDLLSFEDYLSMKVQVAVYDSNAKGYERVIR